MPQIKGLCPRAEGALPQSFFGKLNAKTSEGAALF